jgi:hypothetical protein
MIDLQNLSRHPEKEAFAIACGRMPGAFFAAPLPFVRASPSRKLHPQSLQRYLCLPPTIPFLIARSDPHFLHFGIASSSCGE